MLFRSRYLWLAVAALSLAAFAAVGAFVVGHGLGFAPDLLAAGLSEFSGTRRRFDFKGEVAGIRVFDDYAHHPTEIEATLRAAREVVLHGSGDKPIRFEFTSAGERAQRRDGHRRAEVRQQPQQPRGVARKPQAAEHRDGANG